MMTSIGFGFDPAAAAEAGEAGIGGGWPFARPDPGSPSFCAFP